MTTINSNVGSYDVQQKIYADVKRPTFDLAHTHATQVIFANETAQTPEGQESAVDNKDSKTKEDKSDGKIGFWKAAGNTLKGVKDFFWGMVSDENGDFDWGQCLKTATIGAIIGAATLLVPGAGTVLALGFLGMGAYHTVSAGIDIYNAKTDAEDERAWQNLGSGLTETLLAFIGCKKTNAFSKAGKALETVKDSGVSLKNAYQNGGVDALRSEAGLQFSEARNSFKTNVIDQTATNWKNLTKADSRFATAEKSYNERIKNAKGAEKTKLTNEYNAYKNGYEQIKNANDYDSAATALDILKKNMESARKAANKIGATNTAKANYRNAQARYNAAKTTMDTRIRAGEFKITNKNGTVSKKTIAKLDRDINTAKDNLKIKRDAYNAAKNATTEAEYAQAQAEYANAIRHKKAIIGNEGYTFKSRAAVIDGTKTPGYKWLTVTAAGRGYNQAA